MRRKALPAVAVVAVIILPPHGVSVHEAGQQFKRDIEAIMPSFAHFENQYQAWYKGHDHWPRAAARFFGPMVEDMVRLRRELASQQWPTRFIAIQAFEADTTLVWGDLAQLAKANTYTSEAQVFISVNQEFDRDTTYWSKAARTVENDLGVNP